MTLRLAKSALTSADLLARLAGQDAVVKTVTAIAASTQDAIKLAGRAGGTSSYVATLTPGTLTASRTWTVPDRSDTFAGLGAQTFTGLQVFDVGTAAGAISGTASTGITLGAGNGASPQLVGVAFGAGALPALQLFGRSVGGTRAAPTATPDQAALAGIFGSGHDAVGAIGSILSRARYVQSADGAWSLTNNGTYHVWEATPNGSTTRAEWMRLQNANLTVGVAPNGITTTTAATQDGIRIQGRDGGTSSYVATLTPGTLTSSRTITVPDLAGTMAVSGANQDVAFGAVRGRGNNQSFITSRNAADNATIDVLYLNATDQIILGGGANLVRMSGGAIIGTDPGGSELLRVNGVTLCSSLKTSASLITFGSQGLLYLTGNEAYFRNSADNGYINVYAAGIGLGTSLTAGNGAIQLATHTTKAGGIALGTDCFIYRIASDIVRRSHFATRYRSDLQINASGMLVNIYDDTGATYMPMEFDGSTFTVKTGNATTALTIDTSQNATFAGNLTLGSASAASSCIVNGSSSGTGGGSRLRVQNGGSDVIQIGNESAIRNTAYNTTGVIRSTGALKLETNNTTAITIDASQGVTFAGIVKIGTSPPTASTDPGSTGQITWDASYIYVCVNTNTWKRAALATW